MACSISWNRLLSFIAIASIAQALANPGKGEALRTLDDGRNFKQEYMRKCPKCKHAQIHTNKISTNVLIFKTSEMRKNVKVQNVKDPE